MEQNDKSPRMKLRYWIMLVIIGLVVLAFIIDRATMHVQTKMQVQEAYAISNLWTILSAQEHYNSEYGSFGTFQQLEAAWILDSDYANATTASSAKSGYYFVMRLGKGTWCCGARPAEWGVTGERSFRFSQDGVIYFSLEDEDMTITTSGTALGG